MTMVLWYHDVIDPGKIAGPGSRGATAGRYKAALAGLRGRDRGWSRTTVWRRPFTMSAGRRSFVSWGTKPVGMDGHLSGSTGATKVANDVRAADAFRRRLACRRASGCARHAPGNATGTSTPPSTCARPGGPFSRARSCRGHTRKAPLDWRNRKARGVRASPKGNQGATDNETGIATARRGNLQPSGRGGCQVRSL